MPDALFFDKPNTRYASSPSHSETERNLYSAGDNRYGSDHGSL